MSKIYEITMNEYGVIVWRLNGEFHSFGDLPAVIRANGTKIWCQHGMLHRLTGPAIEYSNGEVQYWIENERLSKEQFEERVRCLKSTNKK